VKSQTGCACPNRAPAAAIASVAGMKDAFTTVLPIVTLLIGAWLTGRTKKADVRGQMRLEAADLLADLPALLWKKGDDEDWVNVSNAIERLRFRLCLAGMNPKVAEGLAQGAGHFWEHTEWLAEGPDGTSCWIITNEHAADWHRNSAIVVKWLADNWRIRRWILLRRQARKMKATEPQQVLHLGEL